MELDFASNFVVKQRDFVKQKRNRTERIKEKLDIKILKTKSGIQHSHYHSI